MASCPIPPLTLAWLWLPTEFLPPTSKHNGHWEEQFRPERRVWQSPNPSAQVTEAKGTFLHHFSKEVNKPTQTKTKAVLRTRFLNVAKLVALSLLPFCTFPVTSWKGSHSTVIANQQAILISQRSLHWSPCLQSCPCLIHLSQSDQSYLSKTKYLNMPLPHLKPSASSPSP